MVPPSRAEAARKIWGLLHADNGDHRFPADLIPSEKTIERLLAEIPSRVWAKATMGSKTRSAHEPHPGEYASEGFLDLVQMDHTKGDVILVDSLRSEEHTSELKSLMRISYAVFCLKKKTTNS